MKKFLFLLNRLRKLCRRGKNLRFRNASFWLTLLFFSAILAIFFNLLANPIETKRAVAYSQNWKSWDLPFEMAPLAFFSFPSRICSIDSYGAKSDGQTINTLAIARAIDDCARQGGGTVYVPAGNFLTGPIRLESNIRLDVAEGAELRFSRDFDDYLPTVFTRYEGMELYNFSPLIYAHDCHDVAITGQGLLNGQGDAWWPWKSRQQMSAKRLYALADSGIPTEERQFGTVDDGLRPSFIQFVHCERIRVEGILIENGPMWTIHPIYSNDILIRNVRVSTAGPNTDGIVLDSSRNALVENVSLDTEDDAIVIKSGTDRDGRRVGIPSENIIIHTCRVGRANGGVTIGSETSGGIRDVFVSGCRFDGTKRGLRMKSTPGRGGVVENVWMEDIVMNSIQAEAITLDVFYDSKNIVRPTVFDPPIFRHLSFRNISAVGAMDAIRVTGALDNLIQNMSFEDIMISAKNGANIRNVDTLKLSGVYIETLQRPSITATNVQHASFGNPAGSTAHGRELTIAGALSADIQIDTSYPRSAVRIEHDVPKSAITWREQ